MWTAEHKEALMHVDFRTTNVYTGVPIPKYITIERYILLYTDLNYINY
jgi:hypothetical protein